MAAEPAGTGGPDVSNPDAGPAGDGGSGSELRSGRWRRRLPWLLLLLSIPLSFYGGVLAQFQLGPDLDGKLPPQLLFARPGNGLDFGTLQQIFDVMQHEYNHTDLSAGDAFNGAAKGMVQIYLNDHFGDAFSTYYTPDELRRNREFLQGTFGGIGASMGTRDGKLVIVKILAGTPAHAAGLQVGDVVTRIDARTTDSDTVDAAVAKIRGPVGSHVKLTVLRNAATREVDIIRANITVPSVRSKDIAPGTLYIRIYEFGEHTDKDFESALQQGLNQGANRIILDLRANPGGFVSASDSVTSEFVQSGLNVVVVGRDNKREEHHVSGHGVAFTQKLVVLVDETTASAAEITAGALEDNHRATLFGKKTFGKGLVEDDFPLRNGGDLHLTIASWYRPNGGSIDKNGITPDKTVALAKPDDFYDVDSATSDPRKDAQLQAALATLK